MFEITEGIKIEQIGQRKTKKAGIWRLKSMYNTISVLQFKNFFYRSLLFIFRKIFINIWFDQSAWTAIGWKQGKFLKNLQCK